MRTDEIVVALQQRHVIVEVLGIASMTRAPTTQVRTALANLQVQALDETRVHGRGILGVEQGFVQLRLGTSDQLRLHTADPVYWTSDFSGAGTIGSQRGIGSF